MAILNAIGAEIGVEDSVRLEYPPFGSLPPDKQSLWALAYEARLQIGGITTVIVPFGDTNHENGALTNVTCVGNFSALGATNAVFTYSEARDAWDSGLTFEGPDGGVPVLLFNGTDEFLDAPDDGYWSVGAAAFSIVVWVNVVDATSSSIFTKWDLTTGSQLREFQFYLDNIDRIVMSLYDESADSEIARRDNSTFIEGVWTQLIATFDGGTDPGNIKIYQNGVQADDVDDEDDAGFVAMEDLATVVAIGYIENSSGGKGSIFDGKMAGGPLGMLFTQVELTADQVLALYDHDRVLLGV